MPMIKKAAEDGNKKAILAMNMYIYRVKKYIGAYAAGMGGVDLIVFTGGIGENDYHVREGVCKDLGFLGVDFDSKKNEGLKSKDEVLTKPGSKVIVTTTCTNEELVIAMDTMDIIRSK